MQAAPVASKDHQPLQCDTSLPFWISWFPDSIQVGTGMTIGNAEFMSTVNSQNININYVGISTGWGATGTWYFYRHI